jgi:Tfp pilus assembly protein PilF
MGWLSFFNFYIAGMKRIFLFITLFSFFSVFAQDPTPQETARNFLRNGDFDNAILVLNKALQQDGNNLELQKDLALAFFYKRDFARARTQVENMLERDDADVATYQIAGSVYKAMEEVKDADKMYKKALRKFPRSGPLYSEYGELLWQKQDYDAIKQWEKGIEVDPSYAGNYYNAALYYYYTKDKVWTLIYGEIFVNMESLTERATAMKKLVFDAYKEKLFADADIMKDQEKKSPFAKAVLQTLGKQSSVINRGINTEVLTMMRTRFILDWYASHAGKFPYRLFEYHQQLIREGMFEAYNQWLFGTIENLPAFDQWTKNHADAYNTFATFQKGRIFKMPAGQNYQEL